MLDILSDSISRQKEIALGIGKEVDEQNLLLDELDTKVRYNNISTFFAFITLLLIVLDEFSFNFLLETKRL